MPLVALDNNTKHYLELNIVVVLGISDHNLICTIKKHFNDKSEPITTQSRSYKKFDEISFKNDINSIP